MKSVLKINTSKMGYIYNIKGLILENKYTLENALVVLLSNLLTNESIKKGDIGLNDNDFYTGLEIINRINENENKNIIIKFFDFYPNGTFYEDYFSSKNPDYEKFINDKIIKIFYINNYSKNYSFIILNRKIKIVKRNRKKRKVNYQVLTKISTKRVKL